MKGYAVSGSKRGGGGGGGLPGSFFFSDFFFRLFFVVLCPFVRVFALLSHSRLTCLQREGEKGRDAIPLVHGLGYGIHVSTRSVRLPPKTAISASFRMKSVLWGGWLYVRNGWGDLTTVSPTRREA